MLKLHYFPLYGRGEPIRMLLDHAGVKFEENKISFADWPALKASGKFEFGQLPCLEWKDGTQMTQTYAILRALGIEYGYYPWGDFEKMWICDSTIDAIYDVFPKFTDIFMASTDAAKAENLKSFLETTLPTMLKIFDTRLKGRVYFTGKLSIADFAFGSFLSQTVGNPSSPHGAAFTAVLKKFPNCCAFWENFAKENDAHLKARPTAFL